MTTYSTGTRNPVGTHPLACECIARMTSNDTLPLAGFPQSWLSTGTSAPAKQWGLVRVLWWVYFVKYVVQVQPTEMCMCRNDVHSDLTDTGALQTALATAYLAKQLERGSLQVLRCSPPTCMCLDHCSCQ